MYSTRLNQAQLGWFSGLYSILALLAGVLFHTGLIYANLAIFGIGIRLLCLQARGTQNRCIRVSWLGSVIQLYFFAPVYYQVLSITEDSAGIMVTGLCIGFLVLWRIWWQIYLKTLVHNNFGISSVLWLYILQCGWAKLGIGFYQLAPLIIYPMFTPLASCWGGAGPWLILLCLHQKKQSDFLLSTTLLLTLTSFLSLFQVSPEITMPDQVSDITIYAEGAGRDVVEGDAIVARRVETRDAVYHASVGIGSVQGMSIKRHLIPGIEGGYTSAKNNRVFDFQGMKILVLICNDVFFQDFTQEISESEVVVVLSHLNDLAKTPLPVYFDRYLQYLARYYHRPILHVDQHLTKMITSTGHIEA
ncbi:MAG: hypothetical protein VXW87_02075 [Pseudomonadota bacterium]|nr:hypothetical protein [Pseudomonadota bacterium]